MTDEQLGFYHHCLNVSWINDGIPADPAERARVLKRNRNQADARWVGVVASRFIPHKQRPGYLVNPRQEIERELAQHKSVKATESINARYERRNPNSTNVDTNVPIRAYESVSDSSSASRVRGSGGKGIARTARFSEWLAPWPRCANPDEAAQAWISVVATAEDEDNAFAARDRYLQSDEVARGAIQEPAKFLFAQARCNWNGKWPLRIISRNGKKDYSTEELAASIEAFRRTR